MRETEFNIYLFANRIQALSPHTIRNHQNLSDFFKDANNPSDGIAA